MLTDFDANGLAGWAEHLNTQQWPGGMGCAHMLYPIACLLADYEAAMLLQNSRPNNQTEDQRALRACGHSRHSGCHCRAYSVWQPPIHPLLASWNVLHSGHRGRSWHTGYSEYSGHSGHIGHSWATPSGWAELGCLGWAELGWAGPSWAGLRWAGWAGLGWAAPSWAELGCTELGWPGLGRAGLGWAGLSEGWAELSWVARCAGLGWAGQAGLWTALGWAGHSWAGLGYLGWAAPG